MTDEERLGSLSHLTDSSQGPTRSRMVDVGDKEPSDRRAVARARLRFPAGLLARVLDSRGPKGPIEEVARIAGVLAAKRTADLIPLCHPIALDHVDVTFDAIGSDLLEVRCTTRCRRATGVEMEALTGASVAALTVYDMCKALDPSIAIEDVVLLEKMGGKSGHWRRAPTAT